jgi:hypothetical protein
MDYTQLAQLQLQYEGYLKKFTDYKNGLGKESSVRKKYIATMKQEIEKQQKIQQDSDKVVKVRYLYCSCPAVRYAADMIVDYCLENYIRMKSIFDCFILNHLSFLVLLGRGPIIVWHILIFQFI